MKSNSGLKEEERLAWEGMCNYLARGLRRYAGFIEDLPKDVHYQPDDVEMMRAQAERLLAAVNQIESK